VAEFPKLVTDRKAGILTLRVDEDVRLVQVVFEFDEGAMAISSELLDTAGKSFRIDFMTGAARLQQFRIEVKKPDKDCKQSIAIKVLDEFGCLLGPVDCRIVSVVKIGKLSPAALLGEKGEVLSILWGTIWGARLPLKLLGSAGLFALLFAAGLFAYYFRLLPDEFSHRLANAALIYRDWKLPRSQPYATNIPVTELFSDLHQWAPPGGQLVDSSAVPDPEKPRPWRVMRVDGTAARWLIENPIEGHFDFKATFKANLETTRREGEARDIVWLVRGGPGRAYYQFDLHFQESSPVDPPLSLQVTCQHCPGRWGDRPLRAVVEPSTEVLRGTGHKFTEAIGVDITFTTGCWDFTTNVNVIGDRIHPWNSVVGKPFMFVHSDPYERLDFGSFGFGGPAQSGSLLIGLLKIFGLSRGACHDWHIFPQTKS